jgi:membrane protein
MIIGFGFLLIVSLILNAIIIGFNEFIIEKLPFVPVQMIGMVNSTVTSLVLVILFMAIYKMLPDVKLKWKHVLPGAIVTTLLFFLGKYLISLYIGSNSMASIYGAAGSLIVLLLWIYFSAFILYFGAEFTKAYVEHFGGKIHPNIYAEWSDKILLKHYLEEDAAVATELKTKLEALKKREEEEQESDE